MGWGLVLHSLPAGRRGGYGMKPSQRSSWWWAVKWPGWAAWALGGCLLTPETLFMKGSSRSIVLWAREPRAQNALLCGGAPPPPPILPSFFFFFFSL